MCSFLAYFSDKDPRCFAEECVAKNQILKREYFEKQSVFCDFVIGWTALVKLNDAMRFESKCKTERVSN